MSANPFINDTESGGNKYELGEQAKELIQSLTKIKDSAETLHVTDKRYCGHVFDGLKSVTGVDKEAEGSHKVFEEIHEKTKDLKTGVTRELDKIAASTGNILNIDETDINKILTDVTDRNSQERFAQLKDIQDQLGSYYHVFMKDRYENLNSRGRIKNRAEEAAQETPFLKRRAEEEERVLNIRDERISVVARKYSNRLGTFVEIVRDLNSKAKNFEVGNLEQMEERFKSFNRAVVSIKNHIRPEEKL